MELSSELITEATTVLENLREFNSEIRNPAEKWILELRESNPELYMFLLMKIISDSNITGASKPYAAVLLYAFFRKRTSDQQREFNTYWSQIDINIRNEFFLGTMSCINNGNEELLIQSANLLGAFFAIEYPLETFDEQIHQLLEQTDLSYPPHERAAAFQVFLCFTRCCTDYSPNCGKDQIFHQFSPILFQRILAQMNDPSDENLQYLAASIFSQNLSFFYRVMSFPDVFNSMISTIFDFIRLENPKLYREGFSILMKAIDYFYPLLEDYKNDIIELIGLNLDSGNEERIDQACLVLQLIGEVEFDVLIDDKSRIKLRHRDFDHFLGFSICVFDNLLTALVHLTLSIDENASLEFSTEISAFLSLADLACTVGEAQRDTIVEFVDSNINSPEWNIRFASVLMISVALRIPCFKSIPQNILSTLGIYITMLDDPIPIVKEAAMWCLGRCIQKFSELAMNSERFTLVVQKLSEIVSAYSKLSGRACWLLKQCIMSIADTADVSVLTDNFGVLSQFLCDVADTQSTESSDHAYAVSDHAFAALTQLIACTPTPSPDECMIVLDRVVSQLQINMPSVHLKDTPVHTVSKMIWICSVVENILFVHKELVSTIEDKMMEMLLQIVQANDIDLVRESLPAMGAIACSIGPSFMKYLDQLLPILYPLLSGQVNPKSIRPAALLLGDLYIAGVTLPPEVITEFIGLLIQRLKAEDATPTTKYSIITVIGNISGLVGELAFNWLDELLQTIANELKSVKEQHDEESGDMMLLCKLHISVLSTYKQLLPILSTDRNGIKKVKSFFTIFEIVSRWTKRDNEVLSAAVDLIAEIAVTIGRPLHVILNSSVVVKLLEFAISEGDTEQLQQKASEVLQHITKC
ncbi:hypothetical protein TVAG_244490 [Trichomonas vaginalis G3]|uniref:Importin subunit beta-1/Transportin-1-like TPR repeats domain-containing protein n=1 Tax=Trichomonas vaginalis (strain ATCC PRA-98 / G3) TaxID=412133 RepID=A2ES36_TRIV3|nr:ribosomal protein import into nucleus [Trichomonas vaginalis G3]EAY04548.1 hypothetical protein TVAG_244490 [Trichomonas vaginalis G3]KAI5508496.1 ribosomal protein import into nucleus [Trichomonas vaginalis G3]|eukprot:XP_001316771.1 hypothetical protein [Trichomonas vaginalis G3]